MDIYVLKNDLGEYVLTVMNGNVIKTARKEHAKKFFSIIEAKDFMKVVNKKKNEFQVSKY